MEKAIPYGTCDYADNATIWRKPDLAESTDFRLNVAPMLLPFEEAVPLYNEAQILVGWKIQRRYE